MNPSCLLPPLETSWDNTTGVLNSINVLGAVFDVSYLVSTCAATTASLDRQCSSSTPIHPSLLCKASTFGCLDACRLCFAKNMRAGLESLILVALLSYPTLSLL